MKQKKSGNDQLTCNIIKLRGNESLTQFTQIFNTIFEQTKSYYQRGNNPM